METGGDAEAEFPMSDVPRRSSLTAADSPVLSLVVPDVIQKVIRVLREPGVALGMSVAGGIGALPDTHDEVRYHHHYRAMRYSAKHCLAIACRLCVCL